MSLFTTRSWLLVTALLLVGTTSALAQPGQSPVAPEILAPGHWTPFAPVNHEPDWRWFAPADLSEYGCDRPEANEGFFFQYDRLVWAFTRPKRTDIGSEAAERVVFLPIDPALARNDKVIAYINAADTTFIETEWVWGNRFELGYVVDDHGWLFSGSHVHTQDRLLVLQNPPTGGVDDVIGAQIVFNDPFGVTLGFVDLDGDGFDDDLNGNNIYGRPLAANLFFNEDTPPITGVPNQIGFLDTGDRILAPIIFDTLEASNRTTMFSLELMKIWRLPRMHYGGVWEWLVGVRYLNMTDQFDVFGTGGLFDEMAVNARVNNHIVGPQFGARWARSRGRWTVSTEGRFTAGVNLQQSRVEGRYATNFAATTAQPSLTPRWFDDTETDSEFAPTGELRFETQFQLTRHVSLRMGYEGLVAGGTGRASRRVDWTLPNIGVLDAHKNEAFIVNGFNFGFEINR